MNPALILALLQGLAPIVADVIRKYKAAHHGEMPTDAEIHAELEANIAMYLSEGAAWKAQHPAP
jgi:hypothetical protein